MQGAIFPVEMSNSWQRYGAAAGAAAAPPPPLLSCASLSQLFYADDT